MKTRYQVPVFLGFFVMGFVDVVGIATNYAKKDLELKDSVANLLPLTVFIWFALFSVPIGMWMNRIGRKKTVGLGLALTAIAMLIPLATYSFATLLIAFALAGIGNTLLQVALNPLLTNVVEPQKLTSALSAGQFIKAIASFLGPIIAATASTAFGDWKLIFPAFAAISAINTLWLLATPIPENPATANTTSIAACFKLLKDPVITQLLIGVIAIVGIDVGLNTTLPKFLMARTGLPLEKAGLGTSLYFIARTTGSLAGVVLLMRLKNRFFFLLSALTGLGALAALLVAPTLSLILPLIFILGFALANIFPILFATALRLAPGHENEVSGLLIMGVSGGAILLPIMGLLGDAGGPVPALAFLLLAWGYLAWTGSKLR
ncbi:MAG TPA: MFS transporter [Puia sp.]|uniref:MFS transporter n=1 Tax=Puia sp. TaxID=2045100 RepID=UPI002B994A5C|nr:MFS transporter [Puia sp.]HVU98679.1 MFS transporter [Puia sp.]